MTDAQKAFIARVAAAAMQDRAVLPSLTIAQAILESGWGRSTLTRKANALFGIKADRHWQGRVYACQTKECCDGVTFTEETAVFRAYDSWEDSIADHTAFLCGLSRYRAVTAAKDYRTACRAVQAAGYATDPAYAEKLVRLIEQYGLYRFDEKRLHTVRQGDTLTKIARTYGTEVDAVVEKNRTRYPRMTRDYIQIGWVLEV